MANEWDEPSDEELAWLERDDDEEGTCLPVPTVEDVLGPMTRDAQAAFNRGCWAMAGVLRVHGVRVDMEEAGQWVRALGPQPEEAVSEAAAWLARGWRSLSVIRSGWRLFGSAEGMDAVLMSRRRTVEQVERGELPGFCGPEHWLEAVAMGVRARRT